MSNIKIVETRIQVDIRGEHRIVLLDEAGVEWVNAIQGKDTHGRITKLIRKSEDFFFQDPLVK